MNCAIVGVIAETMLVAPTLLGGLVSRQIQPAIVQAAAAVVYTDQGPDQQVPQHLVSSPAEQTTQDRKQNRLVSLSVQDSSLAYVIQTLTRQVKLQVVYDNGDQKFSRRVSINVSGVPAMDALAIALNTTMYSVLDAMVASHETGEWVAL